MEPLVRLTTTVPNLSSAARILKAGDYQARLQARSLVNDAQDKADQMLVEAHEEYQRQHDLGYEEGREAARMEATEQIMETVGQSVDYFARIEEAVADVVMSSVRKIIAGFDDQELTVRVARNALEVVRDQRQVTLRVSPDDETAVRDRIGEMLSGYPGIGYLEVVADHRLKGGGCVLETELGIVDASIELQLLALEKALQSRIGTAD